MDYIKRELERKFIEADRFFKAVLVIGARQVGIEDKKGSIAVGKDADFLVFDNDLLTADPEGISYNTPKEVYFGEKKMK